MHERVLQFERGGSIWVTLITVSSSGSEAPRTSSHLCSTTAGNFAKLGKVQLADLIAGRFRVWFQGRGLPVVLLARWGGWVVSNRGTWPNVYAIIQLLTHRRPAEVVVSREYSSLSASDPDDLNHWTKPENLKFILPAGGREDIPALRRVAAFPITDYQW